MPLLETTYTASRTAVRRCCLISFSKRIDLGRLDPSQLMCGWWCSFCSNISPLHAWAAVWVVGRPAMPHGIAGLWVVFIAIIRRLTSASVSATNLYDEQKAAPSTARLLNACSFYPSSPCSYCRLRRCMTAASVQIPSIRRAESFVL